MIYAQIRIILLNEMHKISWNFKIQTDHLILVKRLDEIWITQKKRICHLVEFAIPVDRRMEIKENKEIDIFFRSLKRAEKAVKRGLLWY